MTAPHIVDPSGLLGEALAEASPDLMRSLLQDVINALLSADADAVAGAEYGRPSSDRVAQRNGYRHRDLDTRVGTIDVAVPKLRTGTYFPEWLLERRKRSESALITVVADCYLAGVSTRRMDKLVKTLGINSLSKSQVSRMAESLDEHVEQFRHRPLDEAGPFTFVSADALTMKVREGGRVTNAVVLLATGVNGDGHREVLGMRVATSETGAAWNSFFADLVARGLAGVRLVTSDAHAGLVEAIAAAREFVAADPSAVAAGRPNANPTLAPPSDTGGAPFHAEARVVQTRSITIANSANMAMPVIASRGFSASGRRRRR